MTLHRERTKSELVTNLLTRCPYCGVRLRIYPGGYIPQHKPILESGFWCPGSEVSLSFIGGYIDDNGDWVWSEIRT